MVRGWLPSNTWINGQLNVNVNLNQTCNAYWDGTALNFFKSGGGCTNTGEIAGVSLHEFGHGIDQNDATGTATDGATGESYGDTTALIALHNSCLGAGFLSSNCAGYGDACTSCTGVRDADYAKHSSNTPATAEQLHPRPLPRRLPAAPAPAARKSTASRTCPTETMWDLAARDLPSPGTGVAWTILDRLWYLSRNTATKSFSCTTGTTYTSNGCSAGSLWKVFRAIDDDNGNLNDGTPHGGALFAAFNRHGIACTTDTGASTTFAGCTPPASPTLSVTGGSNSAALSWTAVGSSTYDVFRNETGCNAGFTKIASGTSATSLSDTAVGNGLTYYYQVTAFPSGNEACASLPSTCISVTPSTTTTPDFTHRAPRRPRCPSRRAATGSVTVTTAVSGGFNTAISLSASGLPAGVTASFSPASIAAPGSGSSTLTFTASLDRHPGHLDGHHHGHRRQHHPHHHGHPDRHQRPDPQLHHLGFAERGLDREGRGGQLDDHDRRLRWLQLRHRALGLRPAGRRDRLLQPGLDRGARLRQLDDEHHRRLDRDHRHLDDHRHRHRRQPPPTPPPSP